MNMAYNPFQQGFLNEDRFFQVLEKYQSEGLFPEWLHSYRKANGLEDSLGVDGFAEITNLANARVRVPFQVKSSQDGINKLYQKHQIHWMDNLRCFIVHPNMSDADIWKQFLGTISKIRRQNEVFGRIEEYLNSAAEAAVILANLHEEMKSPPQQEVLRGQKSFWQRILNTIRLRS